MPPTTRTKLLPLLFVLAIGTAACAESAAVEVDMGSGVRFTPTIADPLGDAGRDASVAVTPDGLPVIAYFAFAEELAPGEIAPARPIGSPSLPAVGLATVSADGYWTRGAVAMAEEIPNVTVAFNPAFEPTVADLTPQNVSGLSLVTDGDTYHAAWASAGGVFYATGSLDPATTTQATVAQVSSAPGLGLSLTVDGSGTPWIAFYTSMSSVGTVDLATPNANGWQVDAIAEGGGCETCSTAVLAGADGMAVAYADPAGGVQIAQNDGENGWVSFEVAAEGGGGLSGAPTSDGFALAYYGAGQVSLAEGTPGSFDESPVAEVAEGSLDLAGARTSVAVGGSGMSVAWVDATSGVSLATGASGSLQEVDLAGATSGGAFPSLAIAEDPATTYLGWYDTEELDALVGAYGDLGDIPMAQPSPTSTEPIAPPSAPPTQECTPVEGGTVTVVAENVQFTDGSCIEAVVGEPFTIAFDNRDAGVQHNVQIFGGADPTGDLLFQGDIVTGAAQADYDVPAFDATGDYAFNCVVHPTMLGTVHVVEAGGGGGGSGGGGTTGLTVTAQNVAFDTSTIELTAGEATTITFVNDDAAVQHNIAIYEDDTLAVELFMGDLVTGPDQTEYEIPALDAGEYYFMCIVHPTMNGSVVVS